MKSKNKVWEEAGKVSIWLNVSFSPKNRLIGWFDEDYTESSTLDPNNIINSLSGSILIVLKNRPIKPHLNSELMLNGIVIS